MGFSPEPLAIPAAGTQKGEALVDSSSNIQGWAVDLALLQYCFDILSLALDPGLTYRNTRTLSHTHTCLTDLDWLFFLIPRAEDVKLSSKSACQSVHRRHPGLIRPSFKRGLALFVGKPAMLHLFALQLHHACKIRGYGFQRRRSMYGAGDQSRYLHLLWPLCLTVVQALG